MASQELVVHAVFRDYLGPEHEPRYRIFVKFIGTSVFHRVADDISRIIKPGDKMYVVFGADGAVRHIGL